MHLRGVVLEAHQNYVLEMKDIRKVFPGVVACDGVNLNVRKGTVHALVGENGAGKSTMMKILAGEYIPDQGEIYFQGKKAVISSTRDALNLGISTVYQELNLVPEMTIAENIFLGRELVDSSRMFVRFKDLYAQAGKYLQELGLKYDPRTKINKLSVSGAQMVEIAKGISRGASLIVLDEPTSAITDSEVDVLFTQIRNLKKKGITFIYISHKMNEIFSISDDVTVMRDGKWVGTHGIKEMNEKKLISLMVGRELSEMFPKVACDIGETVFEVKNLTKKGVFSNISLSVKKGEILGISGLMGAGRTELARAIFGLDSIDSGEILVEGRKAVIKSPADSIRQGVVMLPEDRKQVGLVLIRSVLENIGLSNLDQFTSYELLNIRKERKVCADIAKRVGVKAHNLQVQVKTLSGGNQQKVVICKWLLQKLKVLILDEPTRGIDVGAKSEIHRLMGEFAKKGMAVIMISSELPEMLGMSDRIMVMREGEISGELTREEATQEKIMTLAMGGRKQ